MRLSSPFQRPRSGHPAQLFHGDVFHSLHVHPSHLSLCPCTKLLQSIPVERESRRRTGSLKIRNLDLAEPFRAVKFFVPKNLVFKFFHICILRRISR